MTQGEGKQPDALPCDQAMRIAVLLAESHRGTHAACPVAAPAHAAYGTESSVTSALERFLEALFARTRPDVWSRFRVAEHASLHSVHAAIDRPDLPRRNRPSVPISFPAVRVPTPDGSAWCMLPTLRHTVHVAPDEDFEAVVAREVQRVVAAQDLTPWQHVGLLPAREHRLQFVDVALPSTDSPGRGMRALAAAARRKNAVEALEPVATPLHIESRGWQLAPLVGRDTALENVRSLMEGKERTAVLLTGPAQAGKSALARAWIETTSRLVYQTSGARLVAGMSGLGQWEQRVHAVMGALEELDAALYLEDLEDLLAERVEGGGVDVTAALRPYLEEGRVRLLAEVRSERVDDLERRNWALFAAFTRIAVDPLSAEDTRRALAVRAEHDAQADPRSPAFSDQALDAIVELAERYAPYDAFPGKAMRSYVDLRGTRMVRGLVDTDAAPIGRAEVYDRFSLFTGLPLALLRDDLRLQVDEVAQRLGRDVIGQQAAVRSLAEMIAVIKARLQPAGKPLATFLFVGPTGVGKTELARALARYLFGSPDRLCRFDMSEFMNPAAAERLIHGSESADGMLTRRVREQPFSVVLLDEIEKAHPAVFDLLLQVCGEGRLTDVRGQTTWFHNSIIIMTSNLGARERRARLGFGDGEESNVVYYTRLVHGAFRPEFVNRIDRIIPFDPLSRQEIAAIARLAVD
ncbi:MAG: AAA family ATPase, partial [Myxococcota bacterium]